MAENIIITLERALKEPLILDFASSSFFAKFQCLKGCSECCGYTYLSASEYGALEKPNIKKHFLKNKNGIYEVERVEGRCYFYNRKNRDYYCEIHDNRPLRCRIYPYFPIIVEGRVVITLEPALKMKNHSSNVNTNCPGIGTPGKPLKQSISDCLEYLRSLASAPEILKTVILDNETFQKIRNDRWFLDQGIEKK
ncbi:MAG: YkgJ family cysteine cluster protein [Candidatus Hodarchaeales archaeon]